MSITAAPTFQRLDDAELFLAESRSRPGHLHFVICLDEAWHCTCEATTTCWHIRTIKAAQPSPLDALSEFYPLGRGRVCCDEIRRVRRARDAGHSWHKIAVALGLTSKGAQRRYSPYIVKQEA